MFNKGRYSSSGSSLFNQERCCVTVTSLGDSERVFIRPHRNQFCGSRFLSMSSWLKEGQKSWLLALWMCLEPLFPFINFQQCMYGQATCQAEGSNRDVLFIFWASLISGSNQTLTFPLCSRETKLIKWCLTCDRHYIYAISNECYFGVCFAWI